MNGFHREVIRGLAGIIWLMAALGASAQNPERSITLHLRGVHSCKISLLTLTRAGTFKPARVLESVKNGETATFSIPKELLPGEFVLRFGYKEKET